MTTAPSAKLSVADWVDAGLDLLADGGLRAVKISRLCATLGVTKGSFYWHFGDLDAFLSAVAEGWGAGQDHHRAVVAGLAPLAPRERLLRMAELLSDDHVWRTERAMRDWARTDERVRDAVASADRHSYEQIRQAFTELGFGPDDATVRASTLFYTGIGFIHAGTGGRQATRHQLQSLVEIITSR